MTNLKLIFHNEIYDASINGDNVRKNLYQNLKFYAIFKVQNTCIPSLLISFVTLSLHYGQFILFFTLNLTYVLIEWQNTYFSVSYLYEDEYYICATSGLLNILT